MPSLLEIFPNPDDLLALKPEDLAGILIEIPDSFQSFEVLRAQLFPPRGGIQLVAGFTTKLRSPSRKRCRVWKLRGVIVRNPTQPGGYLRTRQGRVLKTRVDLEAFCKGRILPLDLLQPSLANKVHHLFLRGDHDTAVFQAFKEVEVAVRKAGNYPDDLLGVKLMHTAFNPQDGPLSDMTVVPSERQSEMHLFAGATGHAKNPASHRDVHLSREEAARLIVFASHLLAIVEQRTSR
jgi:uncharacterized protein (TIGR02391 family)